MIDEKKIEAAKEEIYEDRFLLNGEEIVFNNDEKEEMFYKEDIKEAIGLGAKWGINELFKNLWHPASEKPILRNGKCLVVERYNIYKNSFKVTDTKYWKPITRNQFNSLYQAVLIDLNDSKYHLEYNTNWDKEIKNFL